jgi:DivIVA domain-containing protein
MSITPQIIKDQEFQVKFRGYDPIEVKAYLDELAEEFFELQERCRLQVDDLQAFHEQQEELERQKHSLEAAGAEARKMAEELRQTGLLTEQKLAVLANEAEALRNRIAGLEREKQEQANVVMEMEARIQKAEEATMRERAEKESLGHKIALMEEQQREARKDEVDFRSTLSVAQQFCDSLKEKSRQEAQELLDTTRAEIEAIRRAAHAELARLPEEIRALQRKREEAREVLRTSLESYLRNLEIFPEEQGDGCWQDSEELFQKIQILEDGSLSPEDLAALHMEETGAGMMPIAEGESELLSVFDGDESGSDSEDEKTP